jgi:hypothetical protein
MLMLLQLALEDGHLPIGSSDGHFGSIHAGLQ